MRCRHFVIALPLLAATLQPSVAAVGVSVGITLPGVQLGINVPAYPDLQPVPGYPVYYAPGMPMNYFFYDGLYWVYENDAWYSSTWYNGPWMVVEPEIVPPFVLRVPVRYYVRPPVYFRAWYPNSPPRWDEHWGRAWAERHRDWDHWDHRMAQPPAPLPVYQREYSGRRYPSHEQQEAIRQQHYNFQPRDPQVQRVNAQVHQAQAQTRPPADNAVEGSRRELAQVNRPAPEQPKQAQQVQQAQQAHPAQEAARQSTEAQARQAPEVQARRAEQARQQAAHEQQVREQQAQRAEPTQQHQSDHAQQPPAQVARPPEPARAERRGREEPQAREPRQQQSE